MLLRHSKVVWWLYRTTLGEPRPFLFLHSQWIERIDANLCNRLLDKIANDIMVCENKTVTRWNGSIGDYKKHLRKKMLAAGGV